MKENQKSLLENCQLIAKLQPARDRYQSREKGHNRVEVRRTETFLYEHHDGWADPEWEEHIRAVFRVERIRKEFDTKQKAWRQSQEISFYVSSLCLSAPQAARAIRGHWGIENKNHYVRDVSMKEDASRIRKNPAVFARLRSFALNIMRRNGKEQIAPELYRNALSFDLLLEYEDIF